MNAFSYWLFLFGGVFLYSSFLLGGAPNGGWFGYAPLNASVARLPRRATASTSGCSACIMLGIASHRRAGQPHRHDPEHAGARA